ncbi:MAG: cytochrome c oxidase subunit II [Acidimicrobiia bacterium]
MSGTETLERDEAGRERLTMGIDPWEKNWMRFSVALLVVFAAAVTIAGFAAGFQLPGAESEVDPTTVATEGPWSTPGLIEVAPGQFEAYVLSQAWSFSPRELVVPVGATVDIYVTSSDLQHGFKVTDTNINMQVVPGQVSKLSYTFETVGEFPYICTEYCGQGHAAMFGTVKVVTQQEYDDMQGSADASASNETTTTGAGS